MTDPRWLESRGEQRESRRSSAGIISGATWVNKNPAARNRVLEASDRRSWQFDDASSACQAPWTDLGFMELNSGAIFPEEREEQRIMANKLILTALVLGLLGGLGILAVAPAQDKPSVKSPMPIRPLPPAKPLTPIKPTPAPAPTETTTPVPQTQLTPPMSAAAIQRALAKKIDLELTAVPLSEVVEAIKRQTSLEIHIASEPVNLKDDDKTSSKSIDPADAPGDKPDEKPTDKTDEKPADKPLDKPADKPSKLLDKPAEKPTEKPTEKPADKSAEKPAEKGADNKAAEKPADKAVEKPSASAPRLSVHLKGISAASA